MPRRTAIWACVTALLAMAIPSVLVTASSAAPATVPTAVRAAPTPLIWVPRTVVMLSATLPARTGTRVVPLAGVISGSVTTPRSVAARVTTRPAAAAGTIRLVSAGTAAAKTFTYGNRAKSTGVTLPVSSNRNWVIRNSGRRAVQVRIVSLGYWRVTPPVQPPDPDPDPDPPVDPNPAPVSSDGRLDLSGINVNDVWVDPVNGSDSNSGTSRQTALRTVNAAWTRIPQNTPLTTGVRMQLVAGNYPTGVLVNYWENRWGTATNPIVLNAVDGAHTVTFRGDINLYNSRHFYLIGVDIIRDGDAFHCERCSNILIRNSTLNGDSVEGGGMAHETIKVNQSDHFYIEDSLITGADDNSIDFVAVQYGHLLGNRISRAGDWCAYVKGGSAHILVAENEIYTCGTGGFTAGQGTGIEFMTAPWTNYEAVGIRVVNNIVHDTQGAGVGVNGGYNILLAYNTMYRVGSRSHGMEVVYGVHSCDAAHAAQSTADCANRVSGGGWGTATTADTWIGNKHVFVYNNVLLNPSGFQSQWEHFAIYGPRSQPTSGTNAPNPARTDTDLRIAGNVLWNGPADLALGVGNACLDSNPTCNEAQLLANNDINDWQPALVDPAAGDFQPLGSNRLATEPAVAIPDFGWSDMPAAGMGSSGDSNAVPRNRVGDLRTGWGRPGAF